MAVKALKPKSCRNCKGEFIPRNSFQIVCCPPCAITYNKNKLAKEQERERRKAEKAKKRDLRQRREESQTARELMPSTQAAFNAFIRVRDYGQRCISCNRHMADVDRLRGHNIDCGHYRSRGAASHLRFNTYNAHAQCVQCNRDRSGNVVDYRINLMRRIGEGRVRELENSNQPRTFTVDYLRRLRRIFNRRARHYRKLRGI